MPFKFKKVWDYFELSYAAYLILPRVFLCDMPEDWQERFCQLMYELETKFGDNKEIDSYTVLARKGSRFVKDPLRNYKHVDASAFYRKPKNV